MASTATPTPGERRYRGMTAADRDRDRRERLLEAGLEIFGTEGYGSSTIGGLCAAAGVTQRNFYDHFASREDLLLAVYDRIIEEQATAVLEALGRETEDAESHVRAGLETAVGHWVGDPRRFQLAHVEIVGVSERVERRRFEVLESYAAMIAADARELQRRGLAPERDVELTSAALLAAVNGLLLDWLRRPGWRPIEDIVDELTRLFVAAFGPAPDPGE